MTAPPRPDPVPDFDAAALLDCVDVGVAVIGPDGSLRWGNRRAAELFGRFPTRMGDGPWRVLGVDGRELTRAEYPILRALVGGPRRSECVVGVHHADEEEPRWLWISLERRERDDGSLRDVVITMRDATRDQQVLRQLQAANERTARTNAEMAEALAGAAHLNESVIRMMGDGLVVFGADGRVALSNPAAERILGIAQHNPEKSLAIMELYDLAGRRVPGAELPQRITARSGVPYAAEYAVRSEVGERWISVVTEPAGAPVLGRWPVVVTFRDVSAQHRAFDELQQARDVLERVVSTSPAVLFQVRRAGPELLYVSPRVADLIGVTDAELLGDVDQLGRRLWREDLEAALVAWDEADAAGRPWLSDVRINTDAGVRWIRTRGVPRGEGASRIWTGVAFDATEEHAQARRIQAAQRLEAMGAVTAGIAHNFNNTLAVVLPALEDLADAADLRERPALVDALQAARGAVDLVRRLMRMTRESGGEVSVRAFDVAALVHQTAEMCRRLFKNRIVVETRLAPGVRVALGDEGEVAQVLLNLCINARDAVADVPDPWLRLELCAGEAGEVLLDVTDNGCGMAPEVQRRIGEPFFTTKGAASGTGLGLATAFASVAAMGGRLEFESNPGAGTRFRLALPRGEDAPRVAPPRQAPPAQGCVGEVLVVDDDALVRQSILRRLTRSGCCVTVAEDGASALRLLAERPASFAAVVLDLAMAGVDGREVLERIGATEPGLPVVVLSGYVADPDSLTGAAAVLLKPDGLAEMPAVLTRVARRLPPVES